jgi:IS4 transposase
LFLLLRRLWGLGDGQLDKVYDAARVASLDGLSLRIERSFKLRKSLKALKISYPRVQSPVGFFEPSYFGLQEPNPIGVT